MCALCSYLYPSIPPSLHSLTLTLITLFLLWHCLPFTLHKVRVTDHIWTFSGLFQGILLLRGDINTLGHMLSALSWKQNDDQREKKKVQTQSTLIFLLGISLALFLWQFLSLAPDNGCKWDIDWNVGIACCWCQNAKEMLVCFLESNKSRADHFSV